MLGSRARRELSGYLAPPAEKQHCDGCDARRERDAQHDERRLRALRAQSTPREETRRTQADV